jgi:hypothetical protein
MNFAWWAKCARTLSFLGFLLVALSLRAQSPDSTQPPTPHSPPADADKKPAPRPHRVITNDDIPSRTVPNSTQEIEARLEQLNLCDRACFAQVFKDSQMAFRSRYNYPYPFSNKDDHAFEDAILGRMEALRHNAEWQNMLRNALIAQDFYCRNANAYQEKQARERASGRPITSADIAAEDAASKDAKPGPNYGATTSAIINYKFKIEKDFLLAAIVLYKYFEIIKTPCSSYPTSP